MTLSDASGILAASPAPAPTDITLRLQQLIIGWQGIERGDHLQALHNECAVAAGPGGRFLVPAVRVPVPNPDLLLVRSLKEPERILKALT